MPALTESAADTPRVREVLIKQENYLSDNNPPDQDFMLESASDHSDTESLPSPKNMRDQNAILATDQLFPWPSVSSPDFMAAVVENIEKTATGTFVSTTPSLLACMQQGQFLYQQHQQAAAMAQINSVMMKLKAVQEDKLVKLQTEREAFQSKVRQCRCIKLLLAILTYIYSHNELFCPYYIFFKSHFNIFTVLLP